MAIDVDQEAFARAVKAIERLKIYDEKWHEAALDAEGDEAELIVRTVIEALQKPD